MGKYLHLFETQAEFESAYTGDDYNEPWVSYAIERNGAKYNKTEYEKLLETPLTFEITSDGNVVWKAQETAYTPTIQYKKNDGDWTSITSTTAGTSISVVSGDTVQFKGDNVTYSSGYARYNYFSGTTCEFNVKGNIMSLIRSTGFYTATSFESAYTFQFLFNNCTGLTDTSKLILPATTLSDCCYQFMFSGCTSLTTAPELPATNLSGANLCYDYMFYNCTSLISAPELPATTLADGCYRYMFQNCTSLTTTPALPATTLANSCYYGMFYGCTGLTTVPELPATTLKGACYANMFNECRSLTTAPELPATTLAYQSYFMMFYGCSNLNYIKCLATDISASNCTTNWVVGVASSGTFVKNPSMNDWTTGYSGIPNNWTVEDAS